MTHNEKRFSAVREAQIALVTGAFYGSVHTLTGHPLDTIKSKMQLQSEFSKLGASDVARSIMKEFGIAGYFHGVIPPLLGSALYRGTMMSAYEFGFSYFTLNYPKDHFVNTEQFGCVRPLVPISVVFASVMRGCIESPFEYAKLMGQIEQKWELKTVFRGLHWQILRTTTLLLPVYVTFDYLRRKTNIMKSLVGNFFVTFGIVGLSYSLSWPIETLKNLFQSGLPYTGAGIGERIQYMGGIRGLLRGIAPGALGGGLRNACGMVAFIYAQQFVTKLNLRGK